MSDTVTITLPLPPRELSPNHTVGSRGGRFSKAKKIKAYRLCAGLCITHPNRQNKWPAASCECRFFFRTRARRDRDNLLASMKAAFDGLADAGLIANDAGLTHLPVVVGYDKEFPRVELVVTRKESP